MNDNLEREDKFANYLLVEGDDDKHLFAQLISYHQLSDRFKIRNETLEIKPKNGIHNLLDTLKTELKGSEQRRFGIVVDADTNLAACWQAIRSKLVDVGYLMVPEYPNPDGTIIKQDGWPVIGVWLMPDNKVHGTMEDFAGFLVPRNDLLWPMAGDVLQKVIERDRRFRESYQSKACLHTWLAWQEEPGTPLRLAITKRYLDANAAYAQQFISWIRQLFGIELG